MRGIKLALHKGERRAQISAELAGVAGMIISLTGEVHRRRDGENAVAGNSLSGEAALRSLVGEASLRPRKGASQCRGSF